MTAGRVVFFDGYAGAGRYDDGSPGSPVLFVQAAREVAALRAVTGIFVELDPDWCASLRAALDEADPDGLVNRVVREGELGALLPELLPMASGAALLVFLDPFGTALDLPQLRRLLDRKDKAPTEVLLHFSTSSIARIGGILHAARTRGQLALGERKAVARVDGFLGGTWWHEEFESRTDAGELGPWTATDVAMRVATRFRELLVTGTGYRSVAMPVRPEPGLAPKYVLALFTRNIHGEWFFTDALGRAGLDWQHAVYDARIRAEADQLVARAQREQDGLFELAAVAPPPPPPFDRDAYERQHRQRWVDTIAENVHRLLRVHGALMLVERVDQVYGAVLGQAWEKHVRAAIKRLHRGGIIDDNGIGEDFWRRPIRLRTPDSAAVKPDPGRGNAAVPAGDQAGADPS